MIRKLSSLSEILIGNARSASRPYYTNTANKASLYSQISPLGDPSTSVVPELESWVEKGKKVSVAELQRIIHDLRKRRRFSQALEVSEWMKKRGVCIFSPVEHAVQIELIGKVHGFGSAETYFEALKETEKTKQTYGALLYCYARQCKTEKFFPHLQKMKEMGFASSALTYNDTMSLYMNTGQYEKVPEILAEMKQNKVSPDGMSFAICFNSYGARSDMEGLERALEEMERDSGPSLGWNTYSTAANYFVKAGLTDKAVSALRKSEERLKTRDSVGFNYIMTNYATLGMKDEVLRLWARLKTDCKRRINKDYMVVLQSLMRLGDLEGAEKVLKEWESSGNFSDFRMPSALVNAYADRGECERAEAILKGLAERGKATSSSTWEVVASKYLEKGNGEKGVKCMKTALALRTKKNWKPSRPVVNKVLRWLGDKGSVEEVEEFVKLLKKIIWGNRCMYCALLKAYIRAGKETDEVLERMKNDKVEENEEIKSLLAMGQDDEILEQMKNDEVEENEEIKSDLAMEQDDEVLEQMKNDKVEENEEIKSDLAMEQDDEVLEQMKNDKVEENEEIKSNLAMEQDDEVLEQMKNDNVEENEEIKSNLAMEQDDEVLEQMKNDNVEENEEIKSLLAMGKDS